MRTILGLLLIFSVCLQTAFAGINPQQTKVVGGTTGLPPTGAMGFLDAKDPERLNFKYQDGKNSETGRFTGGNFSVAYASISRVTFGDTKHLRIGQTIALSALAGAGGLLLLLSKSHKHYLTVDYRDEKGQNQMIGFEVGKDAIQPLIDSIEMRTGKKVEFEPRPERHRETNIEVGSNDPGSTL
jgi:hypothetical protein